MADRKHFPLDLVGHISSVDRFRYSRPVLMAPARTPLRCRWLGHNWKHGTALHLCVRCGLLEQTRMVYFSLSTKAVDKFATQQCPLCGARTLQDATRDPDATWCPDCGYVDEDEAMRDA